MYRLLFLALFCTAVSAQGADLLPLYPDDTWMVLGIELKALHEAPSVKPIFQKDGRTLAASKVGTAFGNSEMALLAHFASLFDHADRVTILTGPEQDADRDSFRLFAEGTIDDALLERSLKAECLRLKRTYSTDKIAERTIHVIADADAKYYVGRLAKDLLVLTTTKAGMMNVLELHTGKKKAAPAKVILEQVRSLAPRKTPLWLVVGENKFGNDVLYTSMRATVQVEKDIALEIVMTTPTAAATKQAQEVLNLFGNTFRLAQTQPLQQALGQSLTIKSDKNGLTATAAVPIKLFGDNYAKQK